MFKKSSYLDLDINKTKSLIDMIPLNNVLGKPPKKWQKTSHIVQAMWGQQTLECEPQRSGYLELKKQKFWVSYRVKINGLTKTLSLGRKGT